MVLLINFLQNNLGTNSFVNLIQLPLLCEKTEAHSGTRSYSKPLGRQNCCKVRTLNAVYLTYRILICQYI